MILRNEEDREILREGGRRLATILQETAAQARPGVTLRELDTFARGVIRDYGDEPIFEGYGAGGSTPPFPSVICTSVNDALVHGIPNDHELQEGDILSIDCGIRHRGICTDSAITFGIGDIAPEDAELMTATREALNAQLAVARAGATIGDIGHAAEVVAQKYGYGYPKELGGHGVGLEMHEEPFIFNYGRPHTGATLVENQVLALEPMFARGSGAIRLGPDKWTYFMKDGANGAHFEHTVIIGTDGAEVVTRT